MLDLERARDAEVGDLDGAALAEEDVLRLDVAVDEAALVRERQPVRDRDGELDRAPQRQRARADDQVLEVLALDELEDDVLAPAVLAAVDDGDDVRVRELRDRARLVPEALDVLGVARRSARGGS